MNASRSPSRTAPGVAGLVAGPQVLDHLVRVQDVAPDLVAPAGLDVLALELPDLGLLLLERALEQAGLEDLDRHLLVLGLASLVLALGDDARREVGQPDRRIGLVDVLAAGALRAEGVDPDLVPVELDLDVVLGLREDLDQGERRLAPVLRVERADPHEPMDAALGAQPAVRAPAVDRDGHALEAGLLAFLLVEDLGREAVPLRPAEVHPQEHLGPVGRLGAAGAGADREEGGALVVLTREEQRRPLAREVGLERGGIAFELGLELGVRRLVQELDRGQQVVGAHQEVAPRRHLAAEAVGLAQDLLRGAAVIPEPGFLGQRLDLGDSGFLRLEVKDAPRSTGSVRPGPGWRTLPPSSGPADPGAGSGAAR